MGKDEKVDKKSRMEEIPIMEVEEASAERAVSVRKRMEDEMKKDVTTKPESVKDSPIVMSSQDDEDKNSADLPKIKSDLKHKERQYRSSKEDSSKAEEDEKERRRNEDEKYERRKREERKEIETGRTER